METACPRCERGLVALFTSLVCDWCEGARPRGLERAFVVWDQPRYARGGEFYVFPSRTEAAVWRSHLGTKLAPIVAVEVYQPIEWRETTGFGPKISLAKWRYVLHPDHRYPASPRDAHLASPHTLGDDAFVAA
jgi:hypothetical protein